jgi:hypothetical protein
MDPSPLCRRPPHRWMILRTLIGSRKRRCRVYNCLSKPQEAQPALGYRYRNTHNVQRLPSHLWPGGHRDRGDIVEWRSKVGCRG